ncbi:MAG: B12-binding domain-containing radical SAM protein [Nitrospirae bacterium]|nr:B12-binding domain-containing radical SAM protein [Nitrospirota bacterium]
MKILLVNPPIRTWAKPNVFPLGLGYLAAVLLNAGHEVEVLDLNVDRMSFEDAVERIKKTEFDIFGIGGIVTTYKIVKPLVNAVKDAFPKKPLMVGGSVATSIPRTLLERTRADIACIGEGEETVVELVEALQNGSGLESVLGIWYKDGMGNIHQNGPRPALSNLDDLPLPAWDLFPMDEYLRNPIGAINRNKWIDGSGEASVLSMNLNANRGCPYPCIYCYHDFLGQGYRSRSISNVMKEIDILYKKYGVRYFHFVDDEFSLKKQYVYDFCAAIKAYADDITWGCSGRVNLMTEDMIKTMHEAGCQQIGYGIESGSQKILDILKKKATVQQAKDSVRWTQKYLGEADCSLMVGSPGETRETVQETLDFCKETGLTPEVIFFLTPYPGTDLYDMATKMGKIGDEEDYVLRLNEQGENIMVNMTDFSDQELNDIQQYMISELKAWNKLRHPESR